MSAGRSGTLEREGQGTLAIEIPDAALEMGIQYIPWDLIFPDPQQPRVEADNDLRASIAAGGIRQPITVRPRPGAIGQYQIVDGERRWRGAEGVQSRIPCIVRLDLEDDAERVRTQLITNTGKLLTPVEEARAMAELMASRGGSVTDLAAYLGKPVTTVSQRLNLMQLGPWLDYIQQGVVKYTHAVDVLLRYRGCPDAVHAAVIRELAEATLLHATRADGSDDVETAFSSADDFEDAVAPRFKKHLYPISKKKGDPKPIFNTALHDRECECGGIELKGYDGKRRYCGNPEWWQPLEKAAKKEARAQAKASGTTTKPTRPAERLSFSVSEDVQVLQGPEWDVPKGYGRLVDTSGQWAVISPHARSNEGKEFDPRGVEFPSAALAVLGRTLLVKEQHPVVKEARRAWTQRWADRHAVLGAEFVAHVEKGARGVTTPAVATDTLVALVRVADRDLVHQLVEMATWLELDVAALAKANEKQYGWGDEGDQKRAAAVADGVRKIKPKDAVALLSAFVTAVHKDIDVPSLALLREQKAVAQEIIAAKHPFRAKAAGKGKKTRENAERLAAADDEPELGDAFVDEDFE